jgi:hypothetical protein
LHGSSLFLLFLLRQGRARRAFAELPSKQRIGGKLGYTNSVVSRFPQGNRLDPGAGSKRWLLPHGDVATGFLEEIGE